MGHPLIVRFMAQLTAGVTPGLKLTQLHLNNTIVFSYIPIQLNVV